MVLSSSSVNSSILIPVCSSSAGPLFLFPFPIKVAAGHQATTSRKGSGKEEQPQHTAGHPPFFRRVSPSLTILHVAQAQAKKGAAGPAPPQLPWRLHPPQLRVPPLFHRKVRSEAIPILHCPVLTLLDGRCCYAKEPLLSLTP
ncbi:hypothetical protein BS78_05G127600 [Paspalum vaginatum]|nr:hypothetical protein BS78_05G127600 [Paspalum vaginatum]